MTHLTKTAGGAILAAALACSLAALQNAVAQTAPAPMTVQFAKPDRIRYDDKSLIIDGKPVFIYSGAFHYFRCPKELWKDRFARMKDAGLNCVETYLAWNYHEPDEPASPADFSKLQHMDELNDFIQMARDMGLYVIIRPGPYICAEWDRGGLPEWLLKNKPADYRPVGEFLRSSHPSMLRWDKHWMEAAAKVVKPHQVTNLPAGTPGVILWQVENEFNLCDVPAAEQAAVLRALVEDSLAAGIDVPQFACRTRTANADAYLQAHLFDSITCYPKYDMGILVDRIRNIAEPQPGKFRTAMELQAGWFSEVNGKLSEDMGFSDAQLNQLAMVCLEHGVSLINWYMFYGGSQFGYGAALNMTQSYDYDSPIREHGGVGPRYLAAKSLGLMLQEHGTRLARSTVVPVKVNRIVAHDITKPPQPITYEYMPKDVHVALRRAEDGSQYFFFRTDSRTEGREGGADIEVEGKKLNVQFSLGAFGAQMLYVPAGSTTEKGQWLPKPTPRPARPDALPNEKITVQAVTAAPEEMLRWHGIKPGQSFASMGINDSRFIQFRSTFNLSDEQARNPPTLFAQAPGTTLVFAINGQLVPPETTAAGMVPLTGLVKTGENRVEILLENMGNPNHDNLDADKQAPELMLVPSANTLPLSEWRMKPVATVLGLAGVQFSVVPEVNTLDFPSYSVTNGPNMFAEGTTGVFQATLDVTPAQIATGVVLALGTLDETGTVFVNGQRAGGNMVDHCQPFSSDISRLLKPGKNAIAVLVANRDHAGGLYNGAFAFTRGTPLVGLELSTETRGLAEKYAQPTSTAKWSPLQPTAVAASLLSWYRLEFRTPAAIPNTWVPYHLHLDANLNGQVFFNGHHLGTYWAAKPQRDIWLPECWFSKDGPNVVTLQARPTTSTGPLINLAEVRPYAEFAERR